VKNQHFYSNGKLLISGEYLVLKGAKSLAVPVKAGQEMQVSEKSQGDIQLHWKALVRDEFWFEACFDPESLEIIETSDIVKAQFLRKLLVAVKKLNPGMLVSHHQISVTTNMNFDVDWGFGSSSTLISNLAQWFRVDPFRLHFETSRGSGYDIACAKAGGPVFYTLKNDRPVIEPTGFSPDFRDAVYFVYLGKKQRSHQSIADFSDRLLNRQEEIIRVSEISKELTATHDLSEFEFFINELESIMSGVLNIPTVKETSFNSYPGAVKSLGAWGGDFVMMTWRDGLEELKKYLSAKKMNIVFPFDEIVLQR
jgi:mevalonate kinase